MKNKTITATLALSLLFGSVPVFADGSTTLTPAPTGVKNSVSQTTQVQTVDPNSFFYSLKELLNQLKLVLTFNDTQKADLLIKQANDKITELETLKANGNEKYNKEYSEKINELLQKTNQVLKTASANIKEKDKDAQEKEQQEIAEKQIAYTEVQKHSIAVLTANLQKVPEQGQKGIVNAIAKQEAKLQVETISTSNETPTVQTNTDSSSSNTPQAVTVQSTPQTSVVSPESTTSTTVQAKPEEDHSQKEEIKVKHDNGLHLGQFKLHEEKEKHEHKK
jgi:hypothetical protein